MFVQVPVPKVLVYRAWEPQREGEPTMLVDVVQCCEAAEQRDRAQRTLLCLTETSNLRQQLEHVGLHALHSRKNVARQKPAELCGAPAKGGFAGGDRKIEVALLSLGRQPPKRPLTRV